MSRCALAVCVHTNSRRPLGSSYSMNRRLGTMKSSSGSRLPDFSSSYQIFRGDSEYVGVLGVSFVKYLPSQINFLLWESRDWARSLHAWPPWPLRLKRVNLARLLRVNPFASRIIWSPDARAPARDGTSVHAPRSTPRLLLPQPRGRRAVRDQLSLIQHEFRSHRAGWRAFCAGSPTLNHAA